MAVITRQYAPPTCTLEITAQTSALSQWTRQPVIKSLNFLLSFNQLRDRNQQPLEVQGDREQLDSLSNAVSTYTQALLGQSLMASAEAPELSLADAEALGPSPLAAEAPLTLPVSVHLRPRTLLSHELVLGSLANETSGSVIQLKASQLFDLATALDEYTAEVETLPAPQPVRPVVPVWARAAGIILLVGGTTVALTQFLNSGFGGPTATISSGNQESTPTAPVAKLPSPLPEAPSVRPTQALPQVHLPQRDFGDSGPGQFSDPLAQSGRQTDPFASGQASSKRSPPLPAPVDPNSKTFKVPDAIEAPSTIAGRSPTELGQTNLGRAGVSQPETSVPSARSSAEDSAARPAEQRLQQQDISPAPAADAISKASAPAAVDNTAFDVSPQISEARQYLTQRWQVPANLKQTLQYTLVLKSNGTIEQIKPRGQAATQYLSQTPIPGTNQPFVSPSKTSGNTMVRVVLGADGSVQTFLESSSSD
jgi:hypothetical protein